MRARIVDVSTKLFARRGIDGVSVAEIGLAAGVSKANVMHHFGSKNGLYAACLDGIDSRLHAVVDDVGTGDDPIDSLKRSLEAWAHEYPDDCRVMAYGLLRLCDQPGRWALEGPVERMVDLLTTSDRSSEAAAAIVVDLLGTVTYREMARPLIEARAARTNETKPRRQEQR